MEKSSPSPDNDSLVALESLFRIRYPEKENESQESKKGQASPPDSVLNSPPLSVAALPGYVFPSINASILLQQSNYVHMAAAQAAMAAASMAVGSPRLIQKKRFDSPNSTAAYSAEEQQICKEKVEAALRSKPQRGKKREDLSDKERLELTRSRNREHAKTTRIRKKARYQELLDCETKLNAVSQLEELNALRCSCLEQFLSIRQEMLRCTNNGGDENVAVSPHPDSPQNNASKEVSPVERLVQKVDFSTLLSQLTVESMQFKVIPASIGGVSIDWCVGHSSLSIMNEWDKELAKVVIQNYGLGAERSLVYNIVGGTDGIGFNKTGIANARVELSLNLSKFNKDNVILLGFLSATFGVASSLLQSIEWTTIRDETFSKSTNQFGKQGSDMLQNQSIFPSVVSLDQSSNSATISPSPQEPSISDGKPSEPNIRPDTYLD